MEVIFLSLERIKNNSIIVRECNKSTWDYIKDDFEWRDKSNKILNLPFYIFDVEQLEEYFYKKGIKYYMVSLEPKSFGYSLYLPDCKIPYDLAHLTSLYPEDAVLYDTGELFGVLKSKLGEDYNKVLSQLNKDSRFNKYSMELMELLLKVEKIEDFDMTVEELIKNSLIHFLNKKYNESDIVLWFYPTKDFQD